MPEPMVPHPNTATDEIDRPLAGFELEAEFVIT
jgi:hypothetical protein